MSKSNATLLILLTVLILLLTACAPEAEEPETAAITEPAAISTEPASETTEPVVLPKETAVFPFEKTNFSLQTIDGQDYYVMNEFRYPANMGAPVLGLDGAATFYRENHIDEAAKTIDNVGDAIHYVMEMESFSDERVACEAFIQLLEEDYSDYGYITLYGKDYTYTFAYVNHNNIYYPIDVFNMANGILPWILEAEWVPTEDAYTLCETLAVAFPGEAVIESWVMESLTIPEPYCNPTKHLYPWELKEEVLGPEKVAQLYESGNQYAAEQEITTLEDAITYIKLMDPATWFQSPMKGRPAWKTLIYLLADDYEDVGRINLLKRKPEHREGFYDESAYFGNYELCYVRKDGIYYPVDIISILKGEASWTLMPGNGCTSNSDLDALCRKMAETCPYKDSHHLAQATRNDPMTYWEITSYMYHNGTKMIPVNEFVIPEGLGHPVLSDEEIEALVQETDYEKIAEEITTLGDALHFYNKLRLVKPKYRDSNPHPPFEYFQSAWQVLKDKTAYGFTVCNLTRYLLKEDYDEIGYVFAQAAKESTALMYIYEDGLYYLLCPDTYTTEPREDLWIEWPSVIGCAEDFQTIADSLVEHCWFQSPSLSTLVKEVYLIRCEGDFVIGAVDQNGRRMFPVGTEVTSYYAPEVIYGDTTLDWQSQTRIDN